MTRALIVDDASVMRMMLKKILVKGGYEIAGEAENGADAIEKYKTLKPDFVTMDITMPVLDGIEAVRRIKAFDPKAAILMCSAMGQQKLILEAVHAGANDYIVKPFLEARVIESVHRLLNKSFTIKRTASTMKMER